MKKLNLKLGGIKEMLSREQMKKVVGGYGYGGDGVQCPPDETPCKAPATAHNVACSGGGDNRQLYVACY